MFFVTAAGMKASIVKENGHCHCTLVLVGFWTLSALWYCEQITTFRTLSVVPISGENVGILPLSSVRDKQLFSVTRQVYFCSPVNLKNMYMRVYTELFFKRRSLCLLINTCFQYVTMMNKY